MPHRIKKSTILAVILMLLAGLLIDGYLFLKSESGSASIAQQFSYLFDTASLSSEKSDRDIDSDNDGLKDWEEKLYRTDSNNPDSDGDGYLDGEEVAAGYDPAKKAPGDELTGQNAQKPRPLPKNLTKALSAKLSQGLMEGKIKSFNPETGQPLGTEELEKQIGLGQAMQEAIGQQIEEFLIPQISDNEIKISPKTGKNETITYLNEMGNALVKIPISDKPEIQLFIDAMESGDFSQLEQVRQVYEESYKNLKEVSVPADLADFHKNILGVIWITNNIYAAVKNISQDPLKATIAILQYQKIDEKTNSAIDQLLEQIDKY